MPSTRRTYRLRIRDRSNSYDAFVVTSEGVGGLNPFITAPPSGAGAEFNPLTGATTIGRYTVRVADEVGTVFGDPTVLTDDFDPADPVPLLDRWTPVGDIPAMSIKNAYGSSPGAPKEVRPHAPGGLVEFRSKPDHTTDDEKTTCLQPLTGLLPGAEYEVVIWAQGWGNLGSESLGLRLNGSTTFGVGSDYFQGTFYEDDWRRLHATATATAEGELVIEWGVINRVVQTPPTTQVPDRFWWFSDLTARRLLTTTSSGAALPPDSSTGRIVTTFLADAGGRLRELGRRAIVEESTDGGATYPRVIVAGYVNSCVLESGITYAITVGETLRDEADAEVFAEVTPAFPDGSLLVGGPVFAPFPSAAAPVQADQGGWWVVVTDVTSTQVGLHLVTAFDPADVPPPRSVFGRPAPALNRQYAIGRANLRAKGYFVAADTWTATDQYGSFPRLVARLTTGHTATDDGLGTGTTTVAGEFMPIAAKASVKQILGAVTVVRNKNWLVNGTPGAGLWLDWPDSGTDTQGRSVPPQPSGGDEFYVHVYPRDVSERAPLHVTGHPVDVVTALWASRGIPYNAAAAAAAKAALGAITVAFRLTGKEKLGAFVRDRLFAPFGLGQRVNAAGERELFASRHRPVDGDGAPLPAGTITLADCRDPIASPVFSHEEQGAIAGVTYEWQAFSQWEPDPDGGDPSGESRPFDGVVAGAYRVIGDFDAAEVPVSGAAPVVYTVPGTVLAGDGAPLPSLQAWCDSHASALVSRYGRGPATSELAVFDTATYPVGAEVVVAVPVVPGTDDTLTPTSQRGLPVPAQVTGATRVPAGWDYKLLKTGVTVENGDTGTGTPDPAPADVAPAYTIAASVAAPTTVATVTVTNAATVAEAGLVVRVESAVGASAPAGSGTDLGAQDVATDPTWDTPAVAAGSTVWARARAEGAGVTGAWGAWVSVVLGTATGGASGLATPVITYAFDAGGVLTARVQDAAGYAAVRLVASAIGAATAPTAADVAANGVSDGASPYAFAAPLPVVGGTTLGALAEGQAVYLSAVATDALGNASAVGSVRALRGTAPVDMSPSFVTMAAAATLANERVLTAGAGITLTDGGAGGAVTIAATESSSGVTSGTPADMPLKLLSEAGAAGGTIVRAVPAALTPFWWGPRVHLTAVKSAQIQTHIIRAANAGAKLVAVYSLNDGQDCAALDGGSGPFVNAAIASAETATGVFVTRQGAYANTDAPSQVENVLLGLATVGGDGVSDLEIGAAWLMTRSQTTAVVPPASGGGATPPSGYETGVPADLWSELIDPLGGDAAVAACYDRRTRVSVTSGSVDYWDDARGAVGYGPRLLAAVGNRPTWDATFADVYSGVLESAESPLFALNQAISLVLGFGVPATSGNQPIASVAVLYNADSPWESLSIGMGYPTDGDPGIMFGLRDSAGALAKGYTGTAFATLGAIDTLRVGAVWKDAGSTARARISNAAPGASVTGGSVATVSQAALITNGAPGTGDCGSEHYRWIMVLRRALTQADLDIIRAWSAAHHNTVDV